MRGQPCQGGVSVQTGWLTVARPGAGAPPQVARTPSSDPVRGNKVVYIWQDELNSHQRRSCGRHSHVCTLAHRSDVGTWGVGTTSRGSYSIR